MTDQADWRQLLSPVCAAAHEAGRAIMEIYGAAFTVSHKRDYSPVTEADLAAHEVILEHLEQLTPGVPILSEESPVAAYADRRAWREYWLVDPLDGTREFIKGNDEFTVNIALIVDHVPVLGVVCVPPSQTCYFAARAAGAQKQTGTAPAQAIRTRPWSGGHLVVCASSRAQRTERLEKFLRGLQSYEFLCIGSSLKSCLVAEGRADVYLRYGPTSEWDTAAAQCVVEEAGGGLLDLDLRPLRYNTHDSLINPSFIVVGDVNHEWKSYLPGE